MKLTTVPKAEEVIFQSRRRLAVQTVDVAKAVGCYLAENIFADRDQPATHRSSMDGIGISFSAWQKGQRNFKVQGIQPAGTSQLILKSNKNCIEIMTGAVVPAGCDCIVAIENVAIINKIAFVKSGSPTHKDQFIRKQASEYKKGKLLLSAGTRLFAPQIEVAASVGKATVKIFNPKIAVIGTGDELMEIKKPVKSFQARRSNAYAVEALLKMHGFGNVQRFHFNDNAEVLDKGLKKILLDFDVLILSGGVSMGKFDLIPSALKKLGVKVLFHKVSQKPGKPFWFGMKGSKSVFALPGNPVSTLVCALRYVLPYLEKPKPRFVTLTKSITPNPTLTLFVPVALDDNGNAVSVKIAGSGDYNALVQSDGFVEIPVENEKNRVRFFQW